MLHVCIPCSRPSLQQDPQTRATRTPDAKSEQLRHQIALGSIAASRMMAGNAQFHWGLGSASGVGDSDRAGDDIGQPPDPGTFDFWWDKVPKRSRRPRRHRVLYCCPTKPLNFNALFGGDRIVFGLPTAFISKFLLSRAGTQLDLPRAVDSVVCRPRPRRLGCKSFGSCCFRVTVVVLKLRRTPAF